MFELNPNRKVSRLDIGDGNSSEIESLDIYSGDIPHSACISASELLSENVAVGRLTLNFFASVVPR
jgi:hypothetical protein